MAMGEIDWHRSAAEMLIVGCRSVLLRGSSRSGGSGLPAWNARGEWNGGRNRENQGESAKQCLRSLINWSRAFLNRNLHEISYKITSSPPFDSQQAMQISILLKLCSSKAPILLSVTSSVNDRHCSRKVTLVPRSSKGLYAS